jgi:hypothetical protein
MIPVQYDKWTFLAVVYNQAQRSVTVHVDEQTFYMENTDAGNTIDTVIIGQAPIESTDIIADIKDTSEGWRGHIDNFFVYSTALDEDEVAFLRMGDKASQTYLEKYNAVPGNNGFAAILTERRRLEVRSTETSASDQFTVMLWFRLVRVASGYVANLIDNNQHFSIGVFDGVVSGRTIRYLHYQIGYDGAKWTITRSIPIGEASSDWQHLTLTMDSQNIQLYINGAIIDSISLSSHINIGHGNDITVGGSANFLPGQGAFQLEVDCLTYWTSHLTSTNVNNEMALPVHEISPYFYFPFDEGYGFSTSSTMNGVQAQFKAIDLLSPWVVSTAPYDYKLKTLQQTPLTLTLNVSDYFQNESRFRIIELPQHGNLQKQVFMEWILLNILLTTIM